MMLGFVESDDNTHNHVPKMGCRTSNKNGSKYVQELRKSPSASERRGATTEKEYRYPHHEEMDRPERSPENMEPA